jgi:hypothetical protein
MFSSITIVCTMIVSAMTMQVPSTPKHYITPNTADLSSTIRATGSSHQATRRPVAFSFAHEISRTG